MTFLTSISKVAVVAFLFTFIAILVELYLISRKDKVKKEKKDVELPAFKEGAFKPLDNIKNSPLNVKKVAIDRAPHELSPKYVVGLIGLCAFVFIIVAVSIVFKGSQEEVAENVIVPTRASRPTILPIVSPTISVEADSDEVAIMNFEDETSTDEANILAQAPSPTLFLASPTPTRSVVTVAPTTPLSPTAAITSITTPTPTASVKPTLLKTGGAYNANLIAIVVSFALIAIAFIF